MKYIISDGIFRQFSWTRREAVVHVANTSAPTEADVNKTNSN